jgi:two-component system, sensor histidine kinase RpfC
MRRAARVSAGRSSAGLLEALAKIRAKLRNRSDSEHELTINRLALSGIVFGYLMIAGALGSAGAQEMLRTEGIYFGLYYLISLVFFGHILCRPAISPTRRVLGIFFDIGMFSYGMYIGGESTAPFFPIYLWVIFGNGFRFGLPYLAIAAATSLAGFGLVVLTTDFWREHQSLALGLVASLLFLPLYVSTLIRKLSAAKRQAEEASKAKSLFLASVSHELRTPLNAIIGLSNLLLGTPLNAEQTDMTRTIDQSGRSLLALINSILDFARIEAGQMPKASTDFDLHALVFEMRKILAVQADAKGVRLAIHVTPRVPRHVRGTRQHLNDILMNLTANAVKFTERGYVVINVDRVGDSADRPRLRFEVTDTGIGIDPKAQARIFDSFVQADETIIDRFGGTGLGLALVKQLVELHGGEIGVQSTPGVGSTFWCEIEFEPSTVAASTWTPQGMPIVLLSGDDQLHELLVSSGAVVRTAGTIPEASTILSGWAATDLRPAIVVDAAQIDGDLAACAMTLTGEASSSTVPLVLVAEEPGRILLDGAIRSRFVTSFGRPVAGATLVNALKIAGEWTGSGRLSDAVGMDARPRRKLAVLVAEDNRTNQKVIAKVLERGGHTTQIVDNGEAALDALAAGAFDIVLMDVNMPIMNGVETTKLYRFASIGQSRVPIVALTADATPEMEQRCRDAGMDGCLTKPIEPARLLDMIEQMVQESGDGDVDLASGGGVCSISDHPKFQVAAPSVLNHRVVDDLKSLGGSAFLDELAAEFLADGKKLLGDLQAAVSARDAHLFRERAHALRSAAGNIGAQNIYDMCLAWRQMDEVELAGEGGRHVDKLSAELDRVRAVLAAYTSGAELVGPDAPATAEGGNVQRLSAANRKAV